MSKKTDNSQKNQRIQVFARCRPINSIEKKHSSSTVVEVIPEKKIIVKDKNANREFFFDKVFPPNAKQISVYKAVVEPLIQEVLMGYNCTVFAYGQTGTGKTYTMEGERNNSQCSWEDDPGAGIIPRSLHQLFEDLNKEENVEFSVRVSFLELYNEELFDLLGSTENQPELRLYVDSSKKGSVIIQGLEEINVNSKDEVYAILEKGTSRRQTAATMLNATSSRSHTVFSVTVHIKENTIEGEELLKTGKLNLVDLAGSENVGRSGAVDKRAREAGSINQSLLTLGRVITALIEKQPHVPYRESKLTRILQDSLGGHTKTSIIATISPAICNFDETISTLDYATKAKSITIKPEVNQKMTKRALIKEYTEEIERLRKDLSALRTGDGFHIHMDNYTGLMNEISEKSDLIKDLTNKIELLREENSKIEEMFRITKEELCMTSEKLNQTSQKYEETEKKLSSTANALNHTKQVLTQTTLERDEKQFLINIQSNTEKELSGQAKNLLRVVEETTDDVSRLHAKIDRKTTVEKTNEEKCKEFRTMYQKQFAMLDDLVSHSEKQQTTNLTKTKEDIDMLVQTVQNHQTEMTNFLNQFISLIVSNSGDLSTSVSSGAESQVEWSNSFINLINEKKEILTHKQNSLLLEIIPKLVQEMNSKNSEMEQWIDRVHKQLSHKIQNEKIAVCKKSESRKMLQSSLKKSLDAICKNYEEILNDFKVQSSNISVLEDQFTKDIEERLNGLQMMANSFKELSQSQKEIRKKFSKRDDFLITSLEDNILKLQEMHQPLTNLCESESHTEEHKSALNEILTVMNINEFSVKHQSLIGSQNRVVSEFENFTRENAKEEEKIFLEAENSIKSNLSSLSQNAVNFEKHITDVRSSLENCIKSGEVSINENLANIKAAMLNTSSNITGSKEALDCVTSQLKEEILKRDIEFEKFISEDLLKDIPTGTTPHRKNYVYPTKFAATSPHDRILQRLRSKLAEDTKVAVNLPLDSSFNESDESPVSTIKNFGVSVEVNNASFSSDDSNCYDTDSSASYVSDASIESRKNKENIKKPKKKSRLPKKMPAKGFVKPAPPSIRKPLTTTNSEVAEQFDV